uniref:myosin phosphatase Rho-interacting protein-like n=1 Tax=Doryrhamphus excisus TaxID=161450 RepID=UPI0025AE8927|nr:myosin phosphatase Rho-interacting protein-like [Doryrhamphus excisus]
MTDDLNKHVTLPSEDYYCRRFLPNTFDPSRCGACLRPNHMHLGNNTAQPDSSQEWTSSDDDHVLSEVTSSASSDDIRGSWTYEWSLVHSVSPEWELDSCDADIQSSSANNSDIQQRRRSLSVERNCVDQEDMTRMDPSLVCSTRSPWMDERRGRDRSRRGSESRGVKEQESGYFSPDRRTDGDQTEDSSKRAYRYYERGHPLPNNYVPEPKASVPYRNVNLGVPSQRRNQETYMQDSWRSESPQRYTYHSNFRRGADSLRNSPTRHSSASPDRYRRSDNRMRSLSRSGTRCNAASQHTSGRSSPSRRQGSFASRAASPSRLTPSHQCFFQNEGYESQRGCSRESRRPSQTSNKHSLDSERLYRNLESISRRASSSTFYQNTNKGSQRTPQSREASPCRNGSHSRTSQRELSSRDSRHSVSPGSWKGSSQSVLSIPVSCGSSTSKQGVCSQESAVSPLHAAIVETDKGADETITLSGDRSRSSVRRGMEALLLSEPKRTAQELEAAMTMEDYIVLADIPTIQLESEEEYPGLRRRNQSPSPCRDQRIRTQSRQDQSDFYNWKFESDERGRGRERGRDRREKDSENGRLSQRQSTASLNLQNPEKQREAPATAKERAPPGSPLTQGWMSLLDENGQWRKYWFVLSDASLKYYRNTKAEESDDVEGEIGLSSCVSVSNCDVENNYGLQIETKRAVFTLFAVTSRLRQNWVTLLKQAIQNNINQSDSSSEKGNPISCGLSSCQPAARFTCPDFEPTHSHTTATYSHQANGPHQLTDVKVHANVFSDLHKEEDLDCDWAKRLEERNKWFEDGVPFTEMGSRWDDMQLKRGSVPVPILDTMDSAVSRKWTELERLSSRGMTAQSLIGAQAYQTITPYSNEPPVDSQTCESSPAREEAIVTSLPSDTSCSKEASQSMNGLHIVQTNTAEALQKEAQSLRKQVESIKKERANMAIKVDSPCGPTAPCRAMLEAMEAAHQKELQELQEKHEKEISELERQRQRMLEEERQASTKALEALSAAHSEELEARRLEEAHMETSYRVPQDDMWRSELDVLSERYSQKCLELSRTEENKRSREAELGCKVREMEQLKLENQELKDKLAEEISRMRYFITGQRPDVVSLGNAALEVEGAKNNKA